MRELRPALVWFRWCPSRYLSSGASSRSTSSMIPSARTISGIGLRTAAISRRSPNAVTTRSEGRSRRISSKCGCNIKLSPNPPECDNPRHITVRVAVLPNVYLQLPLLDAELVEQHLQSPEDILD